MDRFGLIPRWLAAALIGLAVCVLLISPVVVFGALTMRTSLAEFERLTDTQHGRNARLAADIVARSMASRAEQLRLLGMRDDVIDALERRDGPALAAFMSPVVSGRPDIATSLMLDGSGRLLARIPSDPASLGQSFADRDYFSGALATRGVFVSEAVTSRIDPSLVVVVLAHAIRQGERVVGIGILTVRPSIVLDDLGAAIDVPGRELLLIDRRAATIASTAGRPALGQLGLPAAAGVGEAVVSGMARALVAATVADTGWTLYVLDDPAYIYAARRALLDEIAGPVVAALVAAAVLAVILAGAYLLLVHQRQRLARANARLQEANARVEAATRAKSDFLASMSHELRTPLNAVLGFSDVLREQLQGTLTERQLRYLGNIHTAGQHLLELINDVLDLSKVEAGRLVLRPEPITLAALLEPVSATATQLAADRGVRFDGSDQPAATVLVDPARTRQILLNLLSNAVKFTPPGGSVLFDVALAGDELRFDVTDTGIGIPEDKRDKVFGLFERLHEGRGEVSGGTGLGLAITKKLVELQGGEIGFASRDGQGTRFWVCFPHVLVESEVGPRLLVVEDDPRDAELMSQLARDAGLRVEVAPSVASAVDAIARSAPTAVILDLRLPDRRGEEVLAALKADPATAAIPVMVVTVEDDDGRMRLLGACDHMTKPIDRLALRRWLDTIVIGGGLHATAAG